MKDHESGWHGLLDDFPFQNGGGSLQDLPCDVLFLFKTLGTPPMCLGTSMSTSFKNQGTSPVGSGIRKETGHPLLKRLLPGFCAKKFVHPGRLFRILQLILQYLKTRYLRKISACVSLKCPSSRTSTEDYD